jgi:hypothetical protein
MPSFISNSEQRSWLVTWLLLASMLLVSVWAYESYLENKKFRASVATNKDLWSWHRMQAGGSKNVLALVGASRMQLGLDTAILRQQLPQKIIVPLSINAHYPMATLQSLAADDAFQGMVILSFTAQMLEPKYWDMQADYNQYYHNSFSYYLALDAKITAHLKSVFRFLNPILGFKDLVKYYTKHQRFPDAPYVLGHADGSASGDYSLVETAHLKKHFVDDKRLNYRENPPMNSAVWAQQVGKLQNHINAIQSRGGKVMLLRFPTDGGHWQLDEAYYPRKQFWDVMIEMLDQVTTIHFKDDAILSSFTLPDTSHIDEKDAKIFTARLIELFKLR